MSLKLGEHEDINLSLKCSRFVQTTVPEQSLDIFS